MLIKPLCIHIKRVCNFVRWFLHHFGDFVDIEYPPMAYAVVTRQMGSRGQTCCMWSIWPFSMNGQSRRLFSGHGSLTTANKVHLLLDL